MPGSRRRALAILLILLVTVIFIFQRSTSTSSTTNHGQNHDRHTRRRRPATELSQRSLRDQLTYLFPYDRRAPFPPNIWQTWKNTPAGAAFPDEWRLFEASWTELHPRHTHAVVSDTAARIMLAQLYGAVPEVLHAYNALPYPVLRADFFRYLILLARGGIYTDIDTAAIRPSSDWVPGHLPSSTYGLVIGIEADPDRTDWADWYSRRIQFCQWTIQAKPGHPALREIVARITQETLARQKNGTLGHYDSNKIIEFTGPAAWTDAVFAFFNDERYFDVAGRRRSIVEAGGGPPDSNAKADADANPAEQLDDIARFNITWRQFTGIKVQKKLGDVVVLPITCFSPGVRQMGAGEDDDPMAFVKHFFDGSWKETSERWIGDPERKKKLAGISVGHDA